MKVILVPPLVKAGKLLKLQMFAFKLTQKIQ